MVKGFFTDFLVDFARIPDPNFPYLRLLYEISEEDFFLVFGVFESSGNS